ncbi:MAG TPA: MotA/TolQ/ExbB proton channel family protein [Longimicrobiales bacterium]|nr:MotA/TolQ/ExbB proton channel family protein [Longimicrobiales bacterium]
MPFLVALLVTIAMEQMLGTVIPADTYFHRLFRPSGGWAMSIVPGLTWFVFIWTLTDLFLKLRATRANEADLARPDVLRLPAIIAQDPHGPLTQKLRSLDGRLLARPVGRRVASVVQHLESTDSQHAHEIIRHEADLEADNAASGYRTAKLFIWAMPILGFIGTVLGVSISVGGFSEFLTTNVSIDDVSQVTAQLGNVAAGLSFAFDTTLIGLLGGLIASIMLSAVQSREEGVLTRIEELGLRILEAAMLATGGQPTPRKGASASPSPSAEFEGMMQARLQQLSTQMEQFTRAVRVGLDGFLDEWAKLPPEVEKVAADLSGLRRHLGEAAASTDQLILETRVLLEGLREASDGMKGGLEASLGSVTRTVEELGAELARVTDGLARSMSGVTERLASSETQLTNGLASLQDAVERNRRDGAVAEEALASLAASIGDLGRRLNELKEAQAALAPVLGQLTGPLELRLVPTAVPSRKS